LNLPKTGSAPGKSERYLKHARQKMAVPAGWSGLQQVDETFFQSEFTLSKEMVIFIANSVQK
jgi:hypothetical protein